MKVLDCVWICTPSGIALEALIDSGVEGVVIAGVVLVNDNREYANEMERGYNRGVDL